MTAAINISDGEQSPEQPQNVAGSGGGQPDEAQLEQPKVGNRRRTGATGKAKDGGARARGAKIQRVGSL